MQIVKFTIDELFGTFSYKFEIDNEQKLFILTGPNGYGKTTILTIINNLSKLYLGYFYKLPFKNIRIEFKDGQVLTIESTSNKSKNNEISSGEDYELESDREICFKWWEQETEITKLVLNKKNLSKANRNYSYEFHRGNYEPRSYAKYRETLENKQNKDVFFDKYSIIAKEQNQAQFLLILKSISTLYLPANRISFYKEQVNSESKAEPMIFQIANSLKRKMEDARIRYLQQSAKQSKELIEKLLNNNKAYSREEYEKKAITLNKKLAELRAFNLYADNRVLPYNDDKKQVLTVWLDDLANRMEVYAEITKKLALFSSLLEDKCFINKKISFNPSSGLRAHSVDGSNIELDKLSSGEQNEIIMLYNFIFELKDGMIVLMDEPEISLHVAWQGMFLNDVKKIAKELNVQFMIATHSPQLIGNNWNKCFDLYEYMNNEFDNTSSKR